MQKKTKTISVMVPEIENAHSPVQMH